VSVARPRLLPALLASLVLLGAGEDATPLSAEQVKQRWHSRLDKRHFRADVRLEVSLGGTREERRLVVWRDDDGQGGERVLVRFEAPPDLRNVGLLYLENTERANDYFLYQPATRRVRRLPETLANEDVYGIDLEFLGFGVAQGEPTRVESLSREETGGRASYRLTERALRPNPRFERRITWLDAETFIPLRTEHQREGRLRLVALTESVENVQGIATPRRISFERPTEGTDVRLEVVAVDYEAPIPDDYFSMLALVKALR
jgi:hypothetical protein